MIGGRTHIVGLADVSVTGAYLTTRAPVAAGEAHVLRLLLLPDTIEVELRVEVVRVSPGEHESQEHPRGVAVRFVETQDVVTRKLSPSSGSARTRSAAGRRADPAVRERPGGLLQQVLLDERHGRVELEVLVLLLGEAVALVVREQVPDGAAVLLHRRRPSARDSVYGTRGSLRPCTTKSGFVILRAFVAGEIWTRNSLIAGSRSSPYSTRRRSRR